MPWIEMPIHILLSACDDLGQDRRVVRGLPSFEPSGLVNDLQRVGPIVQASLLERVWVKERTGQVLFYDIE